MQIDHVHLCIYDFIVSLFQRKEFRINLLPSTDKHIVHWILLLNAWLSILEKKNLARRFLDKNYEFIKLVKIDFQWGIKFVAQCSAAYVQSTLSMQVQMERVIL